MGRALRQAIAERFGLDLADAPTMVTLRGWTNDRDGYIHRDSTAKRVTVLLYLNPATRGVEHSTRAACACCAAPATWRTTRSRCRR